MKRTLLMVAAALALAACEKDYTPTASENPVTFSASADTKTISVKHCEIIEKQNSTDSYVQEDVWTPNGTKQRVTISNNWITIVKGGLVGDDNIEISVAENITGASRSYTLKMIDIRRSANLVITQGAL